MVAQRGRQRAGARALRAVAKLAGAAGAGGVAGGLAAHNASEGDDSVMTSLWRWSTSTCARRRDSRRPPRCCRGVPHAMGAPVPGGGPLQSLIQQSSVLFIENGKPIVPPLPPLAGLDLDLRHKVFFMAYEHAAVSLS